jgi:hypothetical protein
VSETFLSVFAGDGFAYVELDGHVPEESAGESVFVVPSAVPEASRKDTEI